MQIHELTQPKKTKLDEVNPLAAVTGAVGSAVAGAKNVGTAIASPFKNAGAAYSNQQSTAKINSWADRAYRTAAAGGHETTQPTAGIASAATLLPRGHALRRARSHQRHPAPPPDAAPVLGRG